MVFSIYMQFYVNILRIVCIINWRISFMMLLNAMQQSHQQINTEIKWKLWMMIWFKFGFILTLYENRSWTWQVKTASLPTGIVIFAIGEVKFGSAAADFWNAYNKNIHSPDSKEFKMNTMKRMQNSDKKKDNFKQLLLSVQERRVFFSSLQILNANFMRYFLSLDLFRGTREKIKIFKCQRDCL